MAMSELADKPLRVKSEFIGVHWWRLFRWFSNLRLVPRWHEANMRIVLRAVRRYFYDGLTRPGKILFICCLLTFLFSYRSNSNLFLLTAGAGFSLLLWGALLGFVFRPRVSVERRAPVSGIAGQALESKIIVANTGPRGLYNFTLREMVVPQANWPKEWQRQHLPSLAPGATATVPVTFTPKKRGHYALSGVAVDSYFPFFLTRYTRRLSAPCEISILPETLNTPVPSLRKVAEQASKRLDLGTSSTRKGPSLEYSHSRQYQVGDSLRRLDHRAGSRLGQPMTKIFEGSEEVRRDQVYLVVDLSLADFLPWQRRPVDDTPLEKRLALAVEVGRSAQNEGFTLSALATGNQWHQLDAATDFDRLIAGCDPQKTVENALEENARLFPDSIQNPDGLHILVTGRWSDAARGFVERNQANGVLTLVFFIAERDVDTGSLPVGSQFVEIQLPAETGARR